MSLPALPLPQQHLSTFLNANCRYYEYKSSDSYYGYGDKKLTIKLWEKSRSELRPQKDNADTFQFRWVGGPRASVCCQLCHCALRRAGLMYPHLQPWAWETYIECKPETTAVISGPHRATRIPSVSLCLRSSVVTCDNPKHVKDVHSTDGVIDLPVNPELKTTPVGVCEWTVTKVHDQKISEHATIKGSSTVVW